MHFGPWEIVAFGGLYIGAAMLALDVGLRMSPAVQIRFPRFQRINAGRGDEARVPSTCGPYEESALLSRAQERRLLSLYTLPLNAGTVSRIFGGNLTGTQCSLLNGGSACISQSSAGQ
jgi:hypothetical protein